MTAISKKCLEKCGLKASKPENIYLSTFQNKVKRQLMSKVSFDLCKDTQDSAGNLSIHAYVLDQVMAPIKSYPISERQEKYFSDNKITLSDPEILSGKKLEIDMLIRLPISLLMKKKCFRLAFTDH